MPTISERSAAFCRHRPGYQGAMMMRESHCTRSCRPKPISCRTNGPRSSPFTSTRSETHHRTRRSGLCNGISATVPIFREPTAPDVRTGVGSNSRPRCLKVCHAGGGLTLVCLCLRRARLPAKQGFSVQRSVRRRTAIATPHNSALVRPAEICVPSSLPPKAQPDRWSFATAQLGAPGISRNTHSTNTLDSTSSSGYFTLE